VPVTERVAPEDALALITAALGTAVSDIKLVHGSVDCICKPDRFVNVAAALRDTPGIECRFFTFLSAIDRSEVADDPGGLEVLMHVYSPAHVIHVTVHVPIDADFPKCPSITGVFRGAMWHERETHEMFGIDFEGHPRLVNLYLPEDFEGHPGLRSFKLPSRGVKEWPGAKDPEEAAAGGR
jgi:NADH-quinone oxidoreductase subunit C